MSMKISPAAQMSSRGRAPTARMCCEASAMTTLWELPRGRSEKWPVRSDSIEKVLDAVVRGFHDGRTLRSCIFAMG